MIAERGQSLRQLYVWSVLFSQPPLILILATNEQNKPMSQRRIYFLLKTINIDLPILGRKIKFFLSRNLNEYNCSCWYLSVYGTRCWIFFDIFFFFRAKMAGKKVTDSHRNILGLKIECFFSQEIWINNCCYWYLSVYFFFRAKLEYFEQKWREKGSPIDLSKSDRISSNKRRDLIRKKKSDV